MAEEAVTEPVEPAVYTYVPDEAGSYISGIPQRDLTQSDVDALGPVLVADAEASGLYVPVNAKAANSKTTAAPKEEGEE